MKIRAAVLDKPGEPFRIETLELDAPRAGEVLVKIAAAGVCRSDWHLASGATEHPLPVVAGHEGAGVVEAIGEGVSRVKIGDHVTLSWAPACGDCFYCRIGRPSLCSAHWDKIWAGTMLDGTPRLSRNGDAVYHFCALGCFAEYVVVPDVSCVAMDERVPLQIASLIGCAVTTGVGAVLNTAKVAADSSVAIFGAGGVGLSVVMGAKFAGAASIIVIDRSTEKCAVARQFGATKTIVSGEDAIDQIRAVTEGRGADYVFEAVGDPRVQEQCLAAARPGGTIVLAGLAPMGSTTNLPGAILTREEKTVMGCYYGTCDATRDFPLYAEYYRQGKLDLERLVSRTYALDEINTAFDDMRHGKNARGLIVF